MSLIRNLLAAAIVAASTPALAASAAWTNQANEPLIYQTNRFYGPSTVAALSGTPSTGVITNVSLYWGYYASTYGADPSYALEAYICAGGKCGYINAGNKTGTSTIGETYWAGKAANSSWTFQAQAYSSVTKAFVSPLSPSRQFKVTVNYTY